MAAIATLAIHAATVRISPTIWQDEVQIVDYGRVLTPGVDRSYAMTYNAGRQAVLPFNYVGVLLQNAACVASDADPVGPRLSAAIGALFASAAMLGWLIARGSVPWIALACSFLFLWDPLFAQTFRGARIDAWSMGFMLLACWSVRAGPSAWRLLLAGALVGMAGLIWVSAILLVPLVAHEVWCMRRPSERWVAQLRDLSVSLCFVGGSALIAIVLLLLPFAAQFPQMLDGASHTNSTRAGAPGWNPFALAPFFTRNPWILLTALAALAWSRHWSQALVFMLAVAGALASSVYVYRVVYLLPYLLLGIASGASALWSGTAANCVRKPVVLVLAAMLVFSGAISLGARTYVALSQREGRQPELLVSMLEALREDVGERLGHTPTRVFLGDWELYYAARKLGWHYYREAARWSNPEFLEFVRGMDAVIFQADSPIAPDPELMKRLGFERFDLSATREEQRGKTFLGVRVASPYSDYVAWLPK